MKMVIFKKSTCFCLRACKPRKVHKKHFQVRFLWSGKGFNDGQIIIVMKYPLYFEDGAEDGL